MRVYRIFFFLLPYLLSSMVTADNWKSLGQGDQTAQEFLNSVNKKKSEAGPHPFSKGISKEVGLRNIDLSQQSQALFRTDSASQMVSESSDSRPHVKIDLSRDPLMVGVQKIMINPLKEIGGKGTHVAEVIQGRKDEIIQCEESGEDVQHTCHSNLFVKIIQKRGPLKHGSFTLHGPSFYGSYKYLLSMPRVRSKHFVGHITTNPNSLKSFITKQTTIPLGDLRSVSASNNGGWIKVDHKRYSFASYTFHYSYQPLIKVPTFSWTNNCESLESKADQGLCTYGSKVCTQGPATRVIEGVPVKQECWQYAFTYYCSYPSKNDCGPLRARGCVQINSACKQYVGRTCVVYAQTYQCKGGNRISYQIQGGKALFCLDGNCRDQAWENNDELMSTLAQLSILKELQGQFQNGTLFKGEDNRCSKQPLSFKDCCGSGKGWGNDLGLSSCSAQEKALSQKRKKGLCHYVGTYCAKKALGQCIKKKSSYCCFTNKLLKAFHEQGRPQIGLGWGSGKEPLCRGFTVEEIQRIDFSKLDLREVFEDLMKNYKPGKTQNMGQKVHERLEAIKQGLIPKATQQPRQRSEG